MKSTTKSPHGRRQVAVLTDGQKRGMRQIVYPSVALTLILLIGVSANAATTTYDVSFSADTFQIGSGPDPAPVDPVTGSFTVTLDPAVAVTNNTADISLNSLNIALGSSLSFSYDPVAGTFPAGTLRVGGLSFGAGFGSDVIQFNPSTNDFWLYINDFTTTPAFEQLGYTQTSVSSDNLFFTINQTGSANVSVVPEPGSIVLFALGLGGLCCGFSRRHRSGR